MIIKYVTNINNRIGLQVQVWPWRLTRDTRSNEKFILRAVHADAGRWKLLFYCRLKTTIYGFTILLLLFHSNALRDVTLDITYYTKIICRYRYIYKLLGFDSIFIFYFFALAITIEFLLFILSLPRIVVMHKRQKLAQW